MCQSFITFCCARGGPVSLPFHFVLLAKRKRRLSPFAADSIDIFFRFFCYCSQALKRCNFKASATQTRSCRTFFCNSKVCNTKRELTNRMKRYNRGKKNPFFDCAQLIFPFHSSTLAYTRIYIALFYSHTHIVQFVKSVI